MQRLGILGMFGSLHRGEGAARRATRRIVLQAFGVCTGGKKKIRSSKLPCDACLSLSTPNGTLTTTSARSGWLWYLWSTHL